MTKFKWVGPNDSKVMDLIIAEVKGPADILNYGTEIDIPDTKENEVLIERLKQPIEPNFELITARKSAKKQDKEVKQNE